MRNLRGGSKLLALPVLLILSIGTLFVISSRSVQMPPHSADGFDLEGPFSASRLRHLTRALAETPQDMDSAGRLETPPGYTASTTGARLLFAHIGDGEIPSLKRMMVTTFVLINDSIYSASGRLNFYDDSGKALKVKIGNSTASSFPVSLKAGESKTFQTSGTGELKVGWAAVETDQPITGTSSFSMRSSSGTVYTDVGVSESMLNTEFTLFADSIGEADTGVALVNPDAENTVNLRIELRTMAGAIVKTSDLQLPPRGHLARFLTELFNKVSGINEFEGTLRVVGNHPFGGTTLRTSGNLLTTVPMVPAPSARLARQEVFFPHIADGSGSGLKILTSVIVFNNKETPTTATIDFFQSNGAPMTVRLGNQEGSSFTFNLGARAVNRFVTAGTGGIKLGWAKVTADSHVSGAAVFQMFNSRGQAITEVGVNDSSQLETINLLADSIGSYRTGFAIANPDASDPVDVRFSLYNHLGTAIKQKTVTLQPQAHQSQFLDELFKEVAGIEEMQGWVALKADDPIITLSLRQVGTLTTSVPTLFPVRGFTPTSVLDFSQTLPGTAPLVRWRLEQKDQDLATELLEISAPKLGLDTSVLKPRDEIGYGYYLLTAGGRDLAGGIVKAVLTGAGKNDFDLIGAGPAVSLGSVLGSGKLAGTATSGFKLTLGPSSLSPLAWNRNIGLEIDLVFRDGLIVAPGSASEVSISTTYISSSTKEKQVDASVTHRTTQKQTFANAATGAPRLTANRPPLLQPGGRLVLSGAGFPTEPFVEFESYDGETITVAGTLSAGKLICFVPPGAKEGKIRVTGGAVPSNPLWIDSPFAPYLVTTRLPKNPAANFGIDFQIRKTERQLMIQSWQAILLNVGVTFAGLSRNQKVGDYVGPSGSNILVDSVSPSQLVLAVGDDVDDPDGQITIEILDDGTIRITYSRSGTSEVPSVQGAEIESVFRLDGITFTQLSMSNPPLVQATTTSVPSQPGGGETGLVADQGSTVF